MARRPARGSPVRGKDNGEGSARERIVAAAVRELIDGDGDFEIADVARAAECAVARYDDVLNSGDLAQPRPYLGQHRATRLLSGITCLGKGQGHAVEAIRVKANIRPLQIDHAPEQRRRADEQHR